MWSEGTIGIPDANIKDKYTVCHYWVKHYEEPSETYGINGGKISKLMIKIDGQIVCNYDRGSGCRAYLQGSRNGALHSAEQLQLRNGI